MADNNHLDFGVDLLPATTETYNLGTSTKKWNNIYGKKVYSNGTEVSVSGHTHNYAGSSSAGGAATSAVTTANTSDDLYLVGVKNGATTTLLHDTNIIINNTMLSTTGIIQTGRYFHNVATYSCTNTPKEILIKTKIPFANSAHMPKIIIHMCNYSDGLPTEIGIVFYIYNGYFCNMGVTSNTKHRPKITLCTYTESSAKYVGIGLGLADVSADNLPHSYYLHFNVDYLDIWPSVTRTGLAKGWTITGNTSTTSIIPTDDRKNPSYVDQAQTAKQAAFTSTQYGIAYYSDAAGTFASTNAGTSGQYLKSNGNSAPTWESFPSTWTPSSHSHGNITNSGCITTAISKAKDDYLIIGDNSDSGKLGKGPIFCDTISSQSTSSKFLREDGTWSAPSYYTHPTGDGNKHVPANGTGNNGKFLQATGTAGTYQWATLPTANSTTAGIMKLGADGGAATYGHTHTLSIAADTGTNALTFAANSKYKLTAGGKTYIFTTQNDATYLKNIGRLTEMNIDLGSTTYNSKLFISYADGSTTGHKPYQNAMVLNIAWDNLNSNKYGAQIAIGNTTTPHLQLRGCNNGTWDDNWLTVLDSDNTYAANANGNAVTVTCGTAATLATIKDVAVKINVTKPSYNWSDIGSKPALNKLSIVKNNAATFYLMGTTTTISDTASDITAVASTAMTYNGADKGTARITLGTATATSSTGGHFGELFLYSTGTNGTSIKSAANSTAAYVATLQAATGTIAYTADITTAIQALDVAEKTNTASQTIDKISEADGKISVTFKDISITKSQVSDFPTTMTPSSHSHGNITNTGTIGTAGKKKLVIVGTDNKVTTGAEIGSTTTTFLNNAGNWGTPANNAVTHTLKNTAKFYVTGTESATGSTGGDTFDDGVYVTATSGQLNATSYLVATHVMLTYNTTDQSLDFSFV